MTVTAPPAIQARLLDLREIDDELGRIGAHRKRLLAGAELKAAEADRAAKRAVMADRRGALEDARAELKRIESDVQVVEQRLARDRTRLQSVTSPKDAQGLEAEIESLLRRRGTLEDGELEVMQRVEDLDAEVAGLEAEVAAVEAAHAALIGDRDDAVAGLAEQERRATENRAAITGGLPADLLALYERQRARYGVGAALIRARVSGGSGVELTGADLAAIRAAAPDDVVLDPESGCILVRTEESGL